jgi:Tfp pilus assembly PilM family ATPase
VAQRFLALDWDLKQLHLVAASISGGSVRFHQAAVIETDLTPNPAEAERLGKLLRERMKELGIGAAPVLACLGRDRVILKEVRFPAVPLHEEPNVVRYQAVKELTESADDVVIDYVTFPSPVPDAERRAQVMIVRREMVNTYKIICESAGLRLVGLAPRSYGSAACLKRLLGSSVLVPVPNPPDAAVALVTVGEKWAEFCILRGEMLLQARTLTLGPGLPSEIRRNIAVHNGHQPGEPVQGVYLALSGEQAALREKLVESLDIPVHPFDPFAGAEGKQLPTSGRGTFAGAIGLLHLMAQQQKLPVNFVHVKQARPPKDPNERLYVLAGALMVILLLGGIGIGYTILDAKKQEVQLEKDRLQALNDDLTAAREQTRIMKSLHEWETVNWADEIYDVAERLPQITQAFKVRSMDGSPAEKVQARTPFLPAGAQSTAPPPIKELGAQPVARLHLTLDSPSEIPLNKFTEKLMEKEVVGQEYFLFYQPRPHSINRGIYDKNILIRKRSPEQYIRKMPTDR